MPRRSDPHKQWSWKRPGGISKQVRAKNPLCQFVDKTTGLQCTKPSTVVHHLVDWKEDETKFYDWNYLVAVCEFHHPGGQLGDRTNKTVEHSYVATLGILDTVYDHGFGLPQWHDKHTPPRYGYQNHSDATAIGDRALDEALARYKAAALVSEQPEPR